MDPLSATTGRCTAALRRPVAQLHRQPRNSACRRSRLQPAAVARRPQQQAAQRSTSAVQQQDLLATSLRASMAGALLSAGSSIGAVSAALAEEVGGGALTEVPTAGQASGFNAFETLLTVVPLAAYGIFSLYRAKVNPKAKLGDFVFALAGVVVVSNILSIIFLKRRFF